MSRMSPAELRDLAAREITVDLPTAGRAFGIGKDQAYDLFRTGGLPFPSYQLGRAIRVPVAPLVRILLGDDATPDDAGDGVRTASVHPIAAGHDQRNGDVNRYPEGARDAG